MMSTVSISRFAKRMLLLSISTTWIAVHIHCTASAAEPWQKADLGRVEVGGEIGRRIAVTIGANLLKLDIDKDFVGPLADKKSKDGYVAAGKLLDAAVRFAAYQKDPAVLALKDDLVRKITSLQQDDGYIGIMLPEQRVTALWDVHEMGYLVYGLLSDFEFFGNEASLNSARKLADFIIANWSKLPADWGQKTGVAAEVAATGLERTMLRLHTLTHDPKYLDFCVKQRHLAEWSPAIVIGRRPLIEGHIYGFLCRCLAQLELNAIQPDDRLLGPTRKAVDFMLHGDAMAITGGCGQWEIWTDDQDVRGELGETCATAYELRVFDHLLRTTADARYGDLMERLIYNALFAAQSPDGALIRYYAPLEGPREYFPLQNYCCPANYRRIVAELPQMIAYQTPDGIAMNLYSAARGEFKLRSGVVVRLVEETDYPNSGKVQIRVGLDQPASFSLRLRIPSWAKDTNLRVNEEPVPGEPAGRFAAINRTWKNDDVVRLDMPMPYRFVLGRKRQSGRVAVMRGPLVFCLDGSQSKQLAGRDGADLGRITLDPQSISAPVPDKAVRPDGLAVTIQAWKPDYRCDRPGDLTLRLTEFPDPKGTAAYFRLQDFSQACDDELLAGR
jgi:DUF1680 family protein